MLFHTSQISLVFLLFSVYALDQRVHAQKPDQARFIGWVVEPGEPASAVYCPRIDNTLFKYAENSPFVYCDVNDDSLNIYGIRCNGPNVIIAGSFAGTATVTCDQAWPCMTATMILPSLSSSSLSLISCQNSIGLSSRVSTIYWDLPTDLITTLSESATRPALNTGESVPLKDSEGKQNKNMNTGVIVGAVVGGIAGLGLVCGALFLGIRLGKRRSRKNCARDGLGVTPEEGSESVKQNATAEKQGSRADTSTRPITTEHLNGGPGAHSYGGEINRQGRLSELPTENARHQRHASLQELP